MFLVANMFQVVNMEVNMEQLVEVMSDKLLLIPPHHPHTQQVLLEVNNMVRLLLMEHNLFMVKLSPIHQGLLM